MTAEELKNDANWPSFGMIPEEVRKHATGKGNYSFRCCIRFLQRLPGDELGMRTFALKNSTRDGLQIMEIERQTLHSNTTVRRNCYLTTYSGYKVVWKPQTHAGSNWYGYYYSYFEGSDFNRWMQEPKPMGVWAPIINKDLIFDFEQYKNCGYKDGDLFDYLRKYEKDPKVEYFGKLGITPSATLMRKAKKDPKFIKFLQNNAEECKHTGPQAIIYAYDKNVTVNDAKVELYKRRRMMELIKGISKYNIDLINIYDYASGVGLINYRDYFIACEFLRLDMNDTKNSKPYDFKRMHDMRIAEMDSIKRQQEKKAKTQFEKDFKKASKKLQALYFEEGGLVMIIPKTTGDLKREGNRLHHCVGRMGYDAKIINGESIIGFIRAKGDEGTPIATVEYLPEGKKISQCYGDHDRKPEQRIRDFAEAWAKETTRRMKAWSS